MTRIQRRDKIRKEVDRKKQGQKIAYVHRKIKDEVVGHLARGGKDRWEKKVQSNQKVLPIEKCLAKIV